MPTGTRDDPWELSTPPRTSTYTMWADETADPPTLFCQVGSTQLRYQLRCLDDLHAWLVEQGDWVELGTAKACQGGHGRGVGPLRRQSGRRMVRPPQGLSRPLRDVRPATPRGSRQGRAHPRPAQQQGPQSEWQPLEARTGRQIDQWKDSRVSSLRSGRKFDPREPDQKASRRHASESNFVRSAQYVGECPNG